MENNSHMIGLHRWVLPFLYLSLGCFPTFRTEDVELTWYRECSASHEIVLEAAEGIIETPMPGVFAPNCGEGSLSPGICCRWEIRVANPRRWVQIAVLDSTLPVKRSGRCFKNNEITVLDVSNQKVENVCGPVGSARTVIVRTPGAKIGFKGLVKHRSMVTLHYKVIGCDVLPETIINSPLVDRVERTTGFSANVTCLSGDVRFFRCVGRTWYPPPEDFQCNEMRRPLVTTYSNIQQEEVVSDQDSGSVHPSAVTTSTANLGPNNRTRNVLTKISPRSKGFAKILLALIVLGCVTATLVTTTLILVFFRYRCHQSPATPTRQRLPIDASSISAPTQLVDQSRVTSASYVDLNNRGSSAAGNLQGHHDYGPWVLGINNAETMNTPRAEGHGDQIMELLPLPSPCDTDCINFVPVSLPTDEEYTLLRERGNVSSTVRTSGNLSEEVHRHDENSYAIPDMNAERYSGLALHELWDL